MILVLYNYIHKLLLVMDDYNEALAGVGANIAVDVAVEVAAAGEEVAEAEAGEEVAEVDLWLSSQRHHSQQDKHRKRHTPLVTAAKAYLGYNSRGHLSPAASGTRAVHHRNS